MASSGDASAVILEPGVLIRPQTTQEDVVELARRLYNLSDITITEFNAYDDRNYKVVVEDTDKGSEIWPHGYIMKIINTLDSKKLSFIDAQNQMMKYLGSRGIVCPQPVLNAKGQYYSVEKIYKKGEDSGSYNEHVVRLLTFQPGTILHQVTCNNELFFQAGKYIAHFDLVLQGFYHPAFDSHKTLWMLESVPMVRKFQYAVKDQERYKMVTDILDSFDSEVIPHIPELEQGMLHGDYNEQNILVRETADEEGWEISAIIDFGDAQRSCYVFELAIAVCYMMLQAKQQDPLDVGGHVIAGYNTVRSLTDQEFSLLKLCVSARLCQSVVLGAYSHLQDPGNEYILTTQVAGWKLLTCLKNTPQLVLEERWRKIIASYSTL